jgi:hypothetical protein
MNQSFYESRGKEKLNDMRTEGLKSQEFHRSGAPKFSAVRGLPKLIVGLLGLLGLLAMLIR